MTDRGPVILVLDDEPIVTITIKNYLELRGGYQTVTFNHPDEALEYLKTSPVDLIISDQIMPGMNGLEFFNQVKQIQPEAVRVLLTGYAQKDDAIRAINQVGLYQYMEKPWSNEELELVLRNGLERKKLYTSLQKRISDLRIASNEIQRLKDGLVALYLEKSAQPATAVAEQARGQIREIVGSEVRSGARRLLWGFVSVSVLLLASVSYIVYSSFFSLGRETERLRIQLSEVKRNTLSEPELKRWRAVLAGAPSEQIIAEYEESVCFIQGSYVFRDADTGRLLRVATRGEQPLVDSLGSIGLTLNGAGEPYESYYTGTGFLAAPDGRILTNRHVAQPWWADPQAQKFVRGGYRPEHRVFHAYFPHRTEPYNLTTRAVSEEADVALVQASPARNLPKPAVLEEGSSGAAPGAPVLLIAFPLGVEAILARATDKELEQIPGLANLNLDQVARELAKRKMVRPFITQGHLSNVTEEVLAYTAATTLGGSGGPLFNRDGRVIGINFAVLTEFQGASMGLPIRYGLRLLKGE